MIRRRSIIGLVAVGLLLASTAQTSGADRDWIVQTVAALEVHLQRHPSAEPVDVYKLLHQATMGPGHAILDRDAARSRLETEVGRLHSDGFPEPLCEPIGGEPAMVRIHLRPFVEAGHDPGELFEAFVDSANGFEPSPERLQAVLDVSVERLRVSGADTRAAAVEALETRLAGRGFPAVHHSQTFRDAYGPAYRIVTRELAQAHGWCDDLATTDEPTDANADVTGGR